MNKPVCFDEAASVSVAPNPTRHFAFTLLEGHCQVSFSMFVEALALANRCRKSPLFSWTVVSETGASVANSVNLPTAVNGGLGQLDRNSTIVLFGGHDPKRAMSVRVIAWLRRENRRGIACGALGSGVFTLARAGLLDNKSAVVHWAFQNAFREHFPQVEIRDGIFLVEGNIFTSVGSAATLDLAMYLIARSSDASVSSHVAAQMVCSAPRQPGASQRLSAQVRYGSRDPKLLRALKIMSDNLETPLSPSDIADQLGISKRQLERLFKSKIGISPKCYYVKMRLQKARTLLLQTDLRIVEVACACGFGSLPHFSKSYKKAFGVSPSKDTGINTMPIDIVC